jgi:putative lipoic acid-binding regulatory protein
VEYRCVLIPESSMDDFPVEITFKVICRNMPDLRGVIRNLIDEHRVQPEISERESREGRFISFTITALFPSEEVLNNICSRIASLKGVLTMF